MAEKKKTTTKKTAAKPTTAKSTAANAPKSASRTKKSTQTGATAAQATKPASTKSTTTKAAPEAKSAVTTHYTTEPSVWKLRVTNAAKATLRAVRTRRFWAWVGGVAVALFLVLVLWWQWQRSYIAVVGGQYLPVSMMDDQLRANYGSSGVNSIVQQQLIMQEADRKNISISDNDITKELNKVITSSGGQKAYQQQLKELGIPETLLRQQIEVQLMRQELLKDKTKVSDQEVKDYYDQNKSSIDPDGQTGLDGLKDQIKETLEQQKLDSATPDYIDSLKQRFHVETHLDHLSLSFGDFWQQTIVPLPGDLWKFVTGQQ